LCGWLALAALGCNLSAGPTLPPTSSPVITPTATIPIAATLPPPVLVTVVGSPYFDAGPVLIDACFDFLRSVSGQQFVFDDEAALAGFYRQIDRSRVCPVAVRRYGFDFNRYRIIGTVIAAKGCSIALTYIRTLQDASAGVATISLRAETVGTCPYDLIRPVWFAVERDSLRWQISVE
jgi:hypothetical protein